jgi:hypothetical protein
MLCGSCEALLPVTLNTVKSAMTENWQYGDCLAISVARRGSHIPSIRLTGEYVEVERLRRRARAPCLSLKVSTTACPARKKKNWQDFRWQSATLETHAGLLTHGAVP